MSSPADKKARLLRGAADAFLKRGFEATTMQDVAEECGVGKGTLYGYWASKEDLFIEVCLSDFAQSGESIDRAFLESRAPEETLREVVDAILQGVPAILERMPLYFSLWARLSFDARYRETCHRGFRDLYRDFREALSRGLARAQERGAVRRDLDPRDLATIVLCTIDGYTYQRIFAEPDLQLERLERALRAVLFDGMSKEVEAGSSGGDEW